MKYDFIPYNPELKDLAVKLRRNTTKLESIFWDNCLKNKMTGYRFLRQKPLDEFIADFYCAELMLVIEIDGLSHKYQTEEDSIRTEILENYGIKVVRFKNEEVLNKLKIVKEKLETIVQKRAKEIRLLSETP